MAILKINHIVHEVICLSSRALLVTKKLGEKLNFFALFCFCFSLSTEASVLNSLKSKYPDCEIETKSYVLTDSDKFALKEKFPTKELKNFYSYYIKTCERESKVFVLNDLVRTHKQFLLFEYESDKLSQIELLRFMEPKEYMVDKKWYKNFYGIDNKDVHKIDAISGATLTVSSTKYLSFLSMFLIDKIGANEKRNQDKN